jgi:SAM-dependent methyltransferase
MRQDAHAIAAFYASPLGAVAQRMAKRRLDAAWPSVCGLDVLGFGFATPYLDAFRADARRVVALYPAGQGAQVWPADGPGAAALSTEDRLPVMDAMFDRVLLAHALEEADAPRRLLREVWRVMAPEGRLIVMCANRRGPWSIADATPFGHGRPYSRRQLSQLLSEALFEPVASATALFAPPFGFEPLLKGADAFERVGERLWPAFGGVVMMEAVKRLAVQPGAAVANGAAVPVRAVDGARRAVKPPPREDAAA